MILFAFGAFVGAVVALVSVLAFDRWARRRERQDELPNYRSPYR